MLYLEYLKDIILIQEIGASIDGRGKTPSKRKKNYEDNEKKLFMCFFGTFL